MYVQPTQRKMNRTKIGVHFCAPRSTPRRRNETTEVPGLQISITMKRAVKHRPHHCHPACQSQEGRSQTAIPKRCVQNGFEGQEACNKICKHEHMRREHLTLGKRTWISILHVGVYKTADAIFQLIQDHLAKPMNDACQSLEHSLY